jgi:hypothetical protein
LYHPADAVNKPYPELLYKNNIKSPLIQVREQKYRKNGFEK